jgi:hypothetical protein
MSAPDLPALPDDDPYPSLKPSYQRLIDAIARGAKPGPAYQAIYGCDLSSATESASRLLSTNVNVARALDIKKAQLASLASFDRQAWLAEVATLAFMSMQDAENWHDRGVKVSVRDKIVALQTAGKACGWLADAKDTETSQNGLTLNISIDQRSQHVHLGEKDKPLQLRFDEPESQGK